MGVFDEASRVESLEGMDEYPPQLQPPQLLVGGTDPRLRARRHGKDQERTIAALLSDLHHRVLITEVDKMSMSASILEEPLIRPGRETDREHASSYVLEAAYTIHDLV